MKKLLILSMVLGLSSYASAMLSWSVTGNTGPGNQAYPGDNLTLSLDCTDDNVSSICIDWIRDGDHSTGLFTGSTVHPGFEGVTSAGMPVPAFDAWLTSYAYPPTGLPLDDWVWIEAKNKYSNPPTGSGILTLDYTVSTTGTYTIMGGIYGPPLPGSNAIFEWDGGVVPLPPLAITVLEASTALIGLSPLTFEFSALENGPNPYNQILTVRNVGIDTLNWEVAETCVWLTIDPNSGSSTGEPDEVTLSVDISGLSWGEYNCQLTVSDPCAMNSPKYVDVTLDVIGPIIELSASKFDFTTPKYGPNPDDQILTILNAGGDTLNWEITETCDWLQADPNNGSSTGEPDDVTLSVNKSGLDRGTYNCQLTVSDPCAMNSPQTVPVELRIVPGDFDDDGHVDCNDLRILALAWMSESGDDNWNPYCDISDPNDEIINAKDLGVFAMDWQGCGASPGCCPPPYPPFMDYIIEEPIISGDDAPFSVTVEGSYILFEDMIKANCCPFGIWLEMEVVGDVIIIYEYAPGGNCFGMCAWPVSATLGPFGSGCTYTLEVYDGGGHFDGSTIVTIE